MYETVKKDNEKLGSLKSQIGDMGKDYDDMIRAREEAKRQLEAKFEDVYKRLQDNRQFTINEGKKVNDALKEFQIKFETQLKEAEELLLADIEVNKKYAREELDKVYKRLDNLDIGLKEEKEARLKDTDEKLKPIKENIVSNLSFTKFRTKRYL